MDEVFISYAREDGDVARKLAEQLWAAGLEPWLDEERLQPGQDWAKEVETAISRAKAVLLVLSCSSDATRPWVSREWQAILQRSWEAPETRLVPVLLDNIDLPTFLKDRVPLDLRNRDPESFDATVFRRLLSMHHIAAPLDDPSSTQATDRFKHIRGIIESSTEPPDSSEPPDLSTGEASSDSSIGDV